MKKYIVDLYAHTHSHTHTQVKILEEANMEKWHSCDLPIHIPSASDSRPVSSSPQEVEVMMWGKVEGQEVGRERSWSQYSNYKRDMMQNIDPDLHDSKDWSLNF